MTDIVIGVRIKSTSDGSVSSAVRGAAADIEGLKAAQAGAASTAGDLASASSKSADAVEQQGAASREAAAAIQQAVDQIVAAARAADGLTTTLTKTSREVELHGKATQGAGQAAESAAAKIGLEGTAVEYVGRLLTPLIGKTEAASAAKLILAETAGTVAGVLTGALSGGIAVVVGLLGSLALSFFDTKDASDEASKGLDAFAAKQSDIGKYIDLTTGKLKEQNRELILLATNTRNEAIRANDQKIASLSRDAFARVEGRAYDNAAEFATRGGIGEYGDADLKKALADAGGNVVKLDRAIQDLVKTRRPDLAGLAVETNKAAAGATLLVRESQLAGKEIRGLAGDTTALREAQKGAGDSTLRLIELESRHAAATTALDKARSNLQLVELRGTAAVKAKTLSEGDYRKQLDAANAAIVSAEAAEKAARDARTSSNRATREAAKNVRELEQANRELERSLDALQKRFDPAGAAADRYGETLKTIAAGVRAGTIDDAIAQRYRVGAALEEQNAASKATESDPFDLTKGLPDFDKELRGTLDKAADDMAKQLGVAGRKGGQAFRDEGVDAAQAIAQIFGGKVSKVLGPLLGILSGNASGNYNSVGGPAGGVLTLLSGRTGSASSSDNPFAAGLKEGLQGVSTDLNGMFKKVFGDGGLFGDSLSKSLGKTLGQAGGGAATGAAVSGISNALGIKMSGTGAQIGGAVGSFLPIPGGEIIGSIAGGLIGTLFGSAKKGSATIGVGSDGGLEVSSVTGNSSKMKTAASDAGGAVVSALNKIADAFGGSVTGTPSVSIGVRDGDYRVDTSGRGITKVKKGAVDFGDDQAAAIAYATADAIKDGVITGLSEKVAAALKSSTDIDDAVAEALKVDNLETLLGGVDAAIGKTFKDLERGIADRNRIAQKYGFDLVKVEEQNAKDRADAFDKVMKERIGSLQQLLTDLTTGDLAEGTLAEQRQALLTQRATAEADARAGKDGAADTLAEINRKLVELSREAYGTAGDEYASDRASATQSARDIIDLENARVKAQADAAAATNQKLDTANSLTGETNDLLAEINASLRQLAGGAVLGGSGSGGSASGFIDLSRWVALR